MKCALKKCTGIALFILLLFPSAAYAQSADQYEEIAITLTVPRIGSIEIPALIYEQNVYLPIKEIFEFLKIKHTVSANMDSTYGFFIDPPSPYLIDGIKSNISFQNKIFEIKRGELVRTESNLYLKSNYFGSVFGLDCVFSFRSLSVVLNTKLELPAIKEMKLEQMHRNITQLKGEKRADTTLKLKFPMFNLGMADWSIVNIQQKGLAFENTRLHLNVGAIIAGGETNIYLNYVAGQPFDTKSQLYRWRFVNNKSSLVKQITAGNIITQSTASIYGAITGIQFTNAPTTYRRSFGTYRLSNKTEPGWTVELYVNNVLINYVKADASGFFTFEVPLVYGSSIIKLRFYGPWGEERTKEENINIPFNFLPQKEFEYTVSAGVVDDDFKSRFTRASFNYGLNKRITVGGGMEYMSSVSTGKTMPFINGTVRLGSALLISGEHAYKVRTKGILNYRLPSNFQMELNYTKYQPGQTAIRSGKSINNYLEEKKAVLSLPFRRKKFVAYTRFSYNELTVTNMKYTTGEILLSSIIAGINTNLTTSVAYSDPAHKLFYSNLSANFRVVKGIRVTPQIQYEHKQNKLTMLKFEAEKNLFNKGFLNFAYEENLVYKSRSVTLGLRYNFSFAQTSVSVTKRGDITSSVQTARGSLMYNDKSHSFITNSQTNIGKGGLLILPFLDINCNGKRDDGEPRVNGLKVKVNGGILLRNKKDSTVTVTGLEAYTNYYVELDKNSFDNIAWQIKKPVMNIAIEPNHFKLIEVPVSVVGEISGTVYFKNDKGRNGLGRIIINIYSSEGKLVTKLLSETDGYFNFIGLSPGAYTAEIDAPQLNKLSMTNSGKLSFNIVPSKDGSLVDGLEFVLQGAALK